MRNIRVIDDVYVGLTTISDLCGIDVCIEDVLEKLVSDELIEKVVELIKGV